jgi:hypothetical protein
MSTPKPKASSTAASLQQVARANSLVELRASVRFPVRMKIQIKTDRGLEPAETVNVSASGVLFVFPRPLDPDTKIEVDMIMPSQTMGIPQDVVVHCNGRVIRSYRKSDTHVEIAVVIDNYQMIS